MFDGLTDCQNNHGDLVGVQRGWARTLGRHWIWIRVWVPAVFAVLSLGPMSGLGICFLTAQSVSASCPPSRGLPVSLFVRMVSGRGPALPRDPDCPSRWHRACRWTEQGRRCRCGHGLSERRPSGSWLLSLVDFVLGLLQVVAHWRHAFLSLRRPLGN